jgi:hypothetical protein
MHLHPVSIPGCTNTIADFCSRSFHLTDQEFQAQLQSRYPIQPSWRIVTPKPEHVQRMTSALLRTMSPWASAHQSKPLSERPSPCGTTSATASTWTRPYVPTQTPSLPCNSSLIDTAWASCLPAPLRYAAEQWETPFAPSARRWPAWVSRTPALTHQGNWTSASPVNWQNTNCFCHAEERPLSASTQHQSLGRAPSAAPLITRGEQGACREQNPTGSMLGIISLIHSNTAISPNMLTFHLPGKPKRRT